MGIRKENVAVKTILLLLAFVFAGLPARAQDSAPPADADPCLAMHDEGTALFTKEDYAAAIEKFTSARECWLKANNGEETADTAVCLFNIGYIYSGLREYEKALDYHSRSLEAKIKLFGEDADTVADSYAAIASAYDGAGQYRDALANQLKVADIRKKNHGDLSPEAALAMNKLGIYYSYTGDYEKATKNYNDAINIFESAEGDFGDTLANIRYNLASVQIDTGDYAAAEDNYEKVYAMKKEKYGENSIEAASALSGLGNVKAGIGKQEEALKIYQKALEVFKSVQGEKSPDISTLLSNIGSAYQKLGEFGLALQNFQASLDMDIEQFGENHITVAQRYNNMGFAFDNLGLFDKAVENYEKSLKIKIATYGENHPDVALTLNNLALIYKKRGDYPKALEMYNRALNIVLKIFGPSHHYAGVFYDNMGNVYDQLGEFEHAIENHLKAAEIFTAALGEQNEDTAIAYNNVAASYDNLGRYGDAADYYLKALDIMEKIYGLNHPTVATMFDNLGIIFKKTGDPDTALKFHLKALESFTAAFGGDHPEIAVTLNNIAIVYDMKKDKEKALEYYNKALAMWKKYYGDTHPSVALAYNNIGTMQQDAGEQEKAVENFRSCLTVLCGGKQNPAPADCRPSDTTTQCFWLEGYSLWKLKRNEEAATAFTNAADSLDLLRGQLESELAKKHFGKKFYQLFPDGIGAFASLAAEKKDDTILERALSFAEKGIGRVFLEMLGRSQAVVRGGLPDDVIAEGNRLNADLGMAMAAVEQELSLPKEQQSQEDRTAAYSALQQAQSQYDAYEKMLLDKFPAYADLMKPQPRPLSEIRKSVIGENEAAIEYVLGEEFSWLILITRDSMKVAELPARQNLENRIKIFRDKLTSPSANEERFKKSAAELYEILLKPVEDSLKGVSSLLIVPTGQLYFLPFESLYIPEDSGGKYLVERYEVRYAPSLSVLYFSATGADKTTKHTGWLGFGDPVYGFDDPRVPAEERKEKKAISNKTNDLVSKYLNAEDRAAEAGGEIPRIPATGEEVNAIAGLFQKDSAAEDVHLGFSANESDAKKLIPKGYKIIHIAGHGTLGAGDGLEPSLILSTVGDMKGEDGFLQMSEVFNMKSPAEIVVLSACETGRGNLEQGEGVAGMGRAFLYAGAESLVVSLWSVADKETRDLMVRFYKRLIAGEPRESALREAKLEMLSQGLRPFYWAPFILIGKN